MRFYFLLLFTAVVMGIHAQVTMGSSITPPAGSLLNLQEFQSSLNNTTSTRGFLLPRVPLTSLSSLKDIEEVNHYTPEAYSGLMIYNTNDFNESCLTLPSGVYIWTGSSWVNLAGKETSEMSGSYTQDVLVLKRILTDNPNANLDWKFDESDPANPKFIDSGTGVYFTTNSCDQRRLTKLKIKNQTTLLTLNISGATALEELVCENNSSLTSLKLADNPELKKFTCINNSAIKSLNLTKATKLVSLNCYNNPALASLDISYLPKLVDFKCYNNPVLKDINIKGTNNISNISIP